MECVSYDESRDGRQVRKDVVPLFDLCYNNKKDLLNRTWCRSWTEAMSGVAGHLVGPGHQTGASWAQTEGRCGNKHSFRTDAARKTIYCLRSGSGAKDVCSIMCTFLRLWTPVSKVTLKKGNSCDCNTVNGECITIFCSLTFLLGVK